MKIIKLVANNIKKLKAIEITPKGDVIRITGKNGEGKTSVLEAIWYALGGKEGIPTEPVRQGEKEGDIELDLGEYIVTRKFTKGGENTYLEVKNKDGAKFPSPQALLDKLIGDVSFNPIDLMKSTSRDEMLLDIAGLSGKLEELDKKRADAYSQRTFENREVKKLEAQVKKGLEKIELVNVQELLDEIEEVRENHTEIGNLESAITNQEERINILQEEIKDLEKCLSANREKLNTCYKKEKDLTPLEELQTKLNKAEETNQKARDYAENEKIKAEYKERKNKSDSLTEEIIGIDLQKEKLIREAKFPVKEMGYRDGKVTLNDIPLDQLSRSEEVLLGIRIQMELHPELKVILIPDASLLDSESMATLEKLAKDKDYQLWVETVSDEPGKVGIHITDGKVNSIDGIPQ